MLNRIYSFWGSVSHYVVHYDAGIIFYFRPAKVSIIFEISNTEKDFLRMGKAILPNHLTLRHGGHKTWEFVFAPFAALREEDRIVSCESCLGYLSQRG